MQDLPPREMVALAVLLADTIGRGSPLSILVPEGQKTLVSTAFEIADEFLKQAKEKP